MLSIRPATIDDAALLTAMIRELAEYEHLAHEVSMTEEDIVRDGFGPHPKFRAVIALWEGEPVGYAVFFEFYSSFQGRAGLFSGRSFCPPLLSAARHWHRSAQARCRNRLARKILLHALGSPGLEQAGHRVLQQPWRGISGRMETVDSHRRRPRSGGQGSRVSPSFQHAPHDSPLIRLTPAIFSPHKRLQE